MLGKHSTCIGSVRLVVVLQSCYSYIVVVLVSYSNIQCMLLVRSSVPIDTMFGIEDSCEEKEFSSCCSFLSSLFCLLCSASLFPAATLFGFFVLGGVVVVASTTFVFFGAIACSSPPTWRTAGIVFCVFSILFSVAPCTYATISLRSIVYKMSMHAS